MPDAVAVRAARPQDLPALLQLEALFPSDQMSRRSLSRFISAGPAIFLVAEHQARLCGNLLMLTRQRSRKARIYSLVVDPSLRGLGIGRRLVLAAEQQARDRNLSSLSLEVRSDNAAARALYASLGYSQAAQLPAYYDDGADGLRLIKTLG